MTKSISGHEECLKNYKLSLSDNERQVLALKERINHMKIESEWYEKQIARAKVMGKDGFDSEKFGVARGKK
jgi:hypothetical protein